MKIPAGNGHDRSDFFPSTHWSVIVAAGESQAEPEIAQDALAELCQTYWAFRPARLLYTGGWVALVPVVYPGQNPLRCRTFTLLAVQRLSALPCEMDFTRVEFCQGKDAKQSAIDYAKARATFGRGEIRAVAKHRHVESVI